MRREWLSDEAVLAAGPLVDVRVAGVNGVQEARMARRMALEALELWRQEANKRLVDEVTGVRPILTPGEARLTLLRFQYLPAHVASRTGGRWTN